MMGVGGRSLTVDAFTRHHCENTSEDVPLSNHIACGTHQAASFALLLDHHQLNGSTLPNKQQLKGNSHKQARYAQLAHHYSTHSPRKESPSDFLCIFQRPVGASSHLYSRQRVRGLKECEESSVTGD